MFLRRRSGDCVVPTERVICIPRNDDSAVKFPPCVGQRERVITLRQTCFCGRGPIGCLLEEPHSELSSLAVARLVLPQHVLGFEDALETGGRASEKTRSQQAGAEAGSPQ